MPGAIAELLRGAPTSPGKVEFAWKTTVGPSLAKVTDVRLEGDVLYVDVASAQWGREIRRSSHVILRRLHTLLGPATVSTLTVRSRGERKR
jgi:hypothetical protein